MCNGCVARVTRVGTGLDINLADKCKCTCPTATLPPVEPSSSELCGKCDHTHAIGPYVVSLPQGPREAWIRVRLTRRIISGST